MRKLILFIASLIISLLLAVIVRAEVMVVGEGIDSLYCQQILEKVERAAGDKVRIPFKVIIKDSQIVLCEKPRITAYAIYEKDIRTITINREYLCPWILAHEFSHVIYCEHNYFHPESWADITASTVEDEPEWLGLKDR